MLLLSKQECRYECFISVDHWIFGKSDAFFECWGECLMMAGNFSRTMSMLITWTIGKRQDSIACWHKSFFYSKKCHTKIPTKTKMQEFLGATKHHYKRVRPSVGRSVGWLVRCAFSFLAVSACFGAPRGQYWLLFLMPSVREGFDLKRFPAPVPLFKLLFPREIIDESAVINNASN